MYVIKKRQEITAKEHKSKNHMDSLELEYIL